MKKYGLPLSVAAGMLLAAALGAVAGARWAGRRGETVVGAEGVPPRETTTVSRGGPRSATVPRFVTAESEPVDEAAATVAVKRTHRAHRGPGHAVYSETPPPPPRSEVGAEGPAPSAAAVARAREVRAALESAVAAYPGLRVRFADCSSGACVARVESSEAAPIDRLISDKQRLPPGFTVRAHERLTAFNGRVFQADFVEEGHP
jgi:hypothetical protein